jgi:predicted MFS family arabinose efflux permease
MAIIPAVAPKEELVRANSVMAGTVQATQALGYALGGILVVWVGFQTLVFIDLLTFLASAVLINMIKLGPIRQQRREPQALDVPLLHCSSVKRKRVL